MTLKTAAAIIQAPKTFGVQGWAYAGLGTFINNNSEEHFTGVLAPQNPHQADHRLHFPYGED